MNSIYIDNRITLADPTTGILIEPARRDLLDDLEHAVWAAGLIADLPDVVAPSLGWVIEATWATGPGIHLARILDLRTGQPLYSPARLVDLAYQAGEILNAGTRCTIPDAGHRITIEMADVEIDTHMWIVRLMAFDANDGVEVGRHVAVYPTEYEAAEGMTAVLDHIATVRSGV